MTALAAPRPTPDMRQTLRAFALLRAGATGGRGGGPLARRLAAEVQDGRPLVDVVLDEEVRALLGGGTGRERGR